MATGWRQRLAVLRRDQEEEQHTQAALRRAQIHAWSDSDGYRPCHCCALCSCTSCDGIQDSDGRWCIRCTQSQHHLIHTTNHRPLED